MSEMRLLLFGDQSLISRHNIQSQLLAGRTNPFLNLFFQKSSDALRREISQLSPLEREIILPFTSIDELNDRSWDNEPHEGIRCALLCLSQLAHYIRYAGEHPASRKYAETCVVGLSTGLLAAAAVALSPAVSDLIPLGVQVVLIAFRLGLHVQSTARNIEIPQSFDDDSLCWSCHVSDIPETTAQAAISEFHKEKLIPRSNHAHVATSTARSARISGPPTTLKQLFATSPAFGKDNLTRLPIYGPYGSHLHRAFDARQLISLKGLESYRLGLPFLSTKLFDKDIDAVTLLTQVVEYILNEQINLQDVISSCTDMALSSQQCTIVSCGPNDFENLVAEALNEAKVSLLQTPDPGGLNSFGDAPRTSKKPKIAIVGMAGRFPDAADHEKFWDLLEKGLDVHRKVPKDRFDVEKHYDPTGKRRNTSHTPYGCFIEEPGLFDPRFFNMSPREATQTDPMHRLGLASAYEALEMAGYVPNRTPSTRLERIGTFYGQTSDDWREINAAQDVDTYFITGGVRAFAPGRINYYFKFTGPSFSVDTACSSSAAAMQLACTSLWAGDCDTAVTGGLNVMTNSDIFAGLSRGQFLSKTGNCKTYDNDADGYCRGDGIGTLILKRLDDALADNDRILGVVLETSTNHSSNAVSITHPHAPTQEVLFQKVMDDAGIDPHDVNYVEMHGTGTQAGDGTEMRSVTNVFAPTSRAGTRKKSLHLGSVKSNVGHGEAVSGVTAMIKCLLMMQKNLVPPHCGIKQTINQTFPQDLNVRNVHMAFKPTPLVSRDGTLRRIFVNNFSAAGGNTAFLIEDAPPSSSKSTADPRGDWVVAISAKSKSALKGNAQNIIKYIKENRNIRLSDLSYTTTARRIQHNYRIAFGCDSLNQAAQILESKLDNDIDPVPNVSPSVAFTYTGQGSHYTALGKQLYELSKSYRSDLKSFASIGEGLGFPSFLPLIEGNVEASDLSPLIVQLGLTCIQMALTQLWASFGVKPDVVIGHSLGEYAALNAAGVISISETIFLVGERARLLEANCTANSHAMLATKSSPMDIDKVEVACINGAEETVFGGTINDVDQLEVRLKREGVKCTKLNVQFAFHTSQVDSILEPYEKLANAITFQKPKIPIISPLLATVLSEASDIDAHYLSRHARETVDFLGGIAAAQQLGIVNEQTIWVELGPAPICSGFIRSEMGQVIGAPTLRKKEAPYKTLADSLSTLHSAGLIIDWNEYHRDFLDSCQVLDLPAYAFDNKTYWIQYTGDWNLHKGQAIGLAALPEIEVPKLSTTTVQKIVSEVVEVDKATVVIESDISRPDLFAAICGHVVNGTALCPSSIYGDMAITVAEYLYKLLRPESESIYSNVCDMEVFKPFIANDNGGKGQTLRLTATADVSAVRANLVFSSGSGKTETRHAKCHVNYGSGSTWLAEWQRNAYLINGRIEELKKAAISGAAHRMLRGMAYKLFGAFVEYDAKYRGMEEVILDSPQLEATAQITFQTTEADGNFVCSPYWIDSVCHLAGFIVNANDAVDSTKQVYVSHGWESMRFAEPLVADKSYRSYVKMQALDGNMVAGDVYIFDGERIIGMCGALKFQCIPRKLLNTFLPPKNPSSPQISAAPAPVAAKSKSAAPKMAKPPSETPRIQKPKITNNVLEIIASEVGVPTSELADSIDFANMGVDSLMSLSISGRMREELDLDTQSSVFVDYPTVGDLKGYLSQYESSDIQIEDSDGTATPSMIESDESSSQDGSVDTPLSPPGSPASPADSDSLSMIIRQTISEEMAVEVAELLSVDDLAALGMDSLMSLSILGILREKAGLSLSADFLVDNKNIQSIETALHINPPLKKPKAQPKQKRVPRKVVVTKPAVKEVIVQEVIKPAVQKTKKPSLPNRFASSVLLQGSPKSAEKTLWLVPDGGGAPTSYVFMEEISPKVVVWGLTSPFVKTPEEYMCGVVGIATKFIFEIKRRQPSGPYNIGGWSAGGVISFETVRQLISGGDVVDTLIFIDTPCPLIIEPLPSSLHRFFGSIGLLGEGDGALERLPPWLLPHFAASVHALSTYDAVPIDPTKCPKVFAMWCEDGVCKGPEDPRPDPYPYGHAQWLLENRSDFGPNLWDEFLDGKKITTRQMPGNHFSMMKAPYVDKLTEFLREAML